MSSAFTEQDLMKAKLLVPEEKLKKALYAFNMYSKQLVDAEVSSQDLESAFKKAELELLSQRGTIDGYLLTKVSQDKEVQISTALSEDAEQDTRAVAAESIKLRSQLVKEKKIRAQKEEYMVLSKEIHSHPTKDEFKKQIQEESDDLAALTQEEQRLEAELELRKKQFALFFYSMEQLQRTIGDGSSNRSSGDGHYSTTGQGDKRAQQQQQQQHVESSGSDTMMTE